MEIDEKQLKELQKLDNAALEQVARAVASAVGAGTRQSERIAANPEKLREKLGSLTQQELQAMVQRISPQQFEAIRQVLQGIDRG